MPTQSKDASVVILDHTLEFVVGMTTLFASYYLQRSSERTLFLMAGALKLKHWCDVIAEHSYNSARQWEHRATICAQWYNELRP
jgi:hypothetical protein